MTSQQQNFVRQLVEQTNWQDVNAAMDDQCNQIVRTIYSTTLQQLN